jgi:3D (Asp-Asp-Asp) domain-containing protein
MWGIAMRVRRTITAISTLVGLSTIAALAQEAAVPKRTIDQFLAPACSKIAAHAAEFPLERIRDATQYFTPLFPAGPDGGLRPEDRRACLNVEGACIVGDKLYNYPDKQGVSLDTIVYKFGAGTRSGHYNKTTALDPCRTLAADRRAYPIGSVIFISEMTNKICPQSGKPVDGCFVVGDVGSAITGSQRFDIFTGECSQYDKRTNSCFDIANNEFVAPPGTPYRVIRRDNPLAIELRGEADAFIIRTWRGDK